MASLHRPPWLPAVAPFVLFLLLTALEPQFPGHYPLVYGLKIALVTGCVLALRIPTEARPQGRGVGLAVLAGIALTAAWFGLDRITPHFAFLGGRTAFDPFKSIPDPAARTGFLAVRFFGLAVLVPVIEEGFYRGFLLRYVTDMDDYRTVPVGTFSALAFGVNVVFFALSHPEWLSAAVFGAAMCGLLARTKNLFACIAAHGVTNLLLGVWVLHTHQWQYW